MRFGSEWTRSLFIFNPRTSLKIPLKYITCTLGKQGAAANTLCNQQSQPTLHSKDSIKGDQNFITAGISGSATSHSRCFPLAVLHFYKHIRRKGMHATHTKSKVNKNPFIPKSTSDGCRISITAIATEAGHLPFPHISSCILLDTASEGMH